MPTAERTLAEGLELQAHGDLAGAEARYRQALSLSPEHPGATHGLGLIVAQFGRFDEALALLRKSVALNPSNASFHANLGAVLAGHGRWEESAAACREAIRLNPGYPDAYVNLATGLRRLGRHAEAADALRDAIAATPGRADLHAALGSASLAVGRRDEAVAACEMAVRLRPDQVAYHIGLASALKESGRLKGAEEACRRAVGLQPDSAALHNNHGVLLRELGRFEDAADSFRRAVAVAPEMAAAHSNLGNTLRKLGALEEAEAACRRAIALDPDLAEGHHNLGALLREEGRIEASIAAYRAAIAIRPDYAKAHCYLGHALLLQGEYEEGAIEYDWHLRFHRPPAAVTRRPRWDGRWAPRQTILLHAGQGFGDAIQFVRYAAQIRERCGRLALMCAPPLLRLLRTAPGIDEVVSPEEGVPDFDCYAPLMALLRTMGTRLETIPGKVPYLAADPDLGARLAPELSAARRPLVGLVWSGSPRGIARSVPFPLLAPLLEMPGVRFVSLQVGERAGDAAALPPGAVLDLSARLGDFADTAAVISRLDLVISVDTAVAHLAGALAKPVWVMLRSAADWRWHLRRTDSPWYPSARLFRQKQMGDWDPVIETIRGQLAAWISKGPAIGASGPDSRISG